MGFTDKKREIEQTILDEIAKSIQQINYGEIVITIHNSKIVQIEKREKKRFQNQDKEVMFMKK